MQLRIRKHMKVMTFKMDGMRDPKYPSEYRAKTICRIPVVNPNVELS